MRDARATVNRLRKKAHVAREPITDDLLIDRCQRQLTLALQARIHATEQAIGQQFAFETITRDATTAIFAHRWPQTTSTVPFDRIFNYVAPVAATTDPLLDRLVDEALDVVIETLPGDPRTVALLHRYQFQPVWQIAWLYRQLATTDTVLDAVAQIAHAPHDDMPRFAAVLCDGYGYEGATRDAWQRFMQAGYRAPGFACFLAGFDHQPAAAGVLHLDGTMALVDGAATLPRYRGNGLQKALLATRMQYARQQGATIAFSRTGAGSISHANLENVGMRLLIESTAWRRL